MALQTLFKTSMGFSADSYARISNFRGTKTDIQVTVEFYYDSVAAATSCSAIGADIYNLPISYGATYQQMYDALKLLPEFAGAIDV